MFRLKIGFRLACSVINRQNVSSDVPNSGRGLPRLPYRTKEWDVDFRSYLKKLDDTKPVILAGDLNVAHKEIGECQA